MVQPAPLITIEPAPNKARSFMSGRAPGGAASAMDHAPGQ